MPDVTYDHPMASIVLPYEPKMNKQQSLDDLLKKAADKVEKELITEYPEEKLMPVLNKLRNLITGIRARKDKKSLYIFVSPFAEKIFYFTPSKELLNKFPPL